MVDLHCCLSPATRSPKLKRVELCAVAIRGLDADFPWESAGSATSRSRRRA